MICIPNVTNHPINLCLSFGFIVATMVHDLMDHDIEVAESDPT
jgi:hypothetical protein